MRTCKWCGADIAHMRANAVFCSDTCRYNWNNAQKASKAVSVHIDAVPVVSPSPASNDALLGLLQALLEEQRLTNQLLMRGPNITINNVAAASANASIQHAPPPSQDAMPDLLEVRAAAKSTSAYNVPFCNMQLGLVGIGAVKDLNDLNDEVLSYALEFGKLPAQTDLMRAILAKRQAKSAGNAKPLQGGDKQFSVPDFDDLDLL